VATLEVGLLQCDASGSQCACGCSPEPLLLRRSQARGFGSAISAARAAAISWDSCAEVLPGKQPPTFDILAWNADTTRMTAGLHRDFLTIAGGNELVTPGEATMLGTSIDLSRVHVDAYVVAGIADHLCPWQSCYRSTQLLGGKSRFVLSTSGHIAAIVNPPGNPKARYQVNTDNPGDPARWLESAIVHRGTWWDDYADWLTDRGGATKAAPAGLGAAGLPPLAEAPGTYVFQS
jgi:polyhydroxyalkanoate synthase